jgi:16S rRNA (adenine1518-N6/adenine1519-N6)-dimethyltransferase
MSLQEVKLQLQKYHITPNKLLGQNFLVDDSLFPKLSNYAALNNNDIVLDAGAGFGFLARFIADKCQTVVAVEKDPQIAKVLHEQVKSLNNVVVVEGDVLRVEVPFFNKVISLPPYYLSSQLVTWLLDRSFDCAVLVVQKEFADRLVAPVSSEKYGWLTV